LLAQPPTFKLNVCFEWNLTKMWTWMGRSLKYTRLAWNEINFKSDRELPYTRWKIRKRAAVYFIQGLKACKKKLFSLKFNSVLSICIKVWMREHKRRKGFLVHFNKKTLLLKKHWFFGVIEARRKLFCCNVYISLKNVLAFFTKNFHFNLWLYLWSNVLKCRINNSRKKYYCSKH
jgi:hypothetical protein